MLGLPFISLLGQDYPIQLGLPLRPGIRVIGPKTFLFSQLFLLGSILVGLSIILGGWLYRTWWLIFLIPSFQVAYLELLVWSQKLFPIYSFHYSWHSTLRWWLGLELYFWNWVNWGGSWFLFPSIIPTPAIIGRTSPLGYLRLKNRVPPFCTFHFFYPPSTGFFTLEVVRIFGWGQS